MTKKVIERELWDSMLDAEMNVRYWGKLSRRFYKSDQWLKIALFIISSGTVASWIFLINIDVLWKVLSGITALVAFVLLITLTKNWIENAELTEKYVKDMDKGKKKTIR